MWSAVGFAQGNEERTAMKLTLSFTIDVPAHMKVQDVQETFEDLKRAVREWKSKARLARAIKIETARVRLT